MEKNPTIESIIFDKRENESIIEAVLNQMAEKYPDVKINVEIERQTAMQAISGKTLKSSFRAKIKITI